MDQADTVSAASNLGASGRSHELGPWARFALRRLVGLVFVLLTLLVTTFLLVHLAGGDPARRIAGPHAPAAVVAQIRTALGLDDPLGVQFVTYVKNAFRLNFGNSFVTGESVATVIGERLPKTVELAAVALVLVLALGIPIGLFAGVLTREGRHPKIEVLFTVETGIAGAIPSYVTATFLAFFFAVWLRWLPVAGAGSLAAVILPALAITLRPIALLSRIVRAETLNVLAQDYVRSARSKRLPSYVVYVRHVLPNALTAALTVAGLIFAGLIGGVVVVENVFAWPGLGTLLVQAVQSLDYPVIEGIVLFLGLAVWAINTLVDLALTVIDPRSLVREG